MHYTYVLECIGPQKDRKVFYVGSTEDLRKRLEQHKRKSVQFTKSFVMIKLIYYEASLSKTDAQRREKELKTGFGRGYINRRLKDYFKNAGLV
ncbi:MAG: GIY-YIG nuclease family protein [Candidatus Ryanbacteria bacterium]|nr:GIY-YIG nuclease family protein [Candidatus Ryanbacteria bacterium]